MIEYQIAQFLGFKTALCLSLFLNGCLLCCGTANLHVICGGKRWLLRPIRSRSDSASKILFVMTHAKKMATPAGWWVVVCDVEQLHILLRADIGHCRRAQHWLFIFLCCKGTYFAVFKDPKICDITLLQVKTGSKLGKESWSWCRK